MRRDSDDVPGNWDTLKERPPTDEDAQATPVGDSEADDFEPPFITLMAISWADLVGMLAVCTGALFALLVLGERPALPAFPWAAALSVVWWAFAGAALVVVRQGTPGMLLAGVCFQNPVPTRRVPWVLVAALAGVATLGVTGLFGAHHSLLRFAAASALVTVEDE